MEQREYNTVVAGLLAELPGRPRLSSAQLYDFCVEVVNPRLADGGGASQEALMRLAAEVSHNVAVIEDNAETLEPTSTDRGSLHDTFGAERVALYGPILPFTRAQARACARFGEMCGAAGGPRPESRRSRRTR